MITITPQTASIIFSPQSVEEEVVQNVRTIISTTFFSVPFQRRMAITPNYLDKPINVAKAMMTDDIIKAIREYEPRATVQEITFTGDAINAQTRPIVRITVNE